MPLRSGRKQYQSLPRLYCRFRRICECVHGLWFEIHNLKRNGTLASEDLIEVEGVVSEVFPGGKFSVTLDDTGRIVMAHLGGKLRQHQIRVVLGDKVQVGLSPYDLTRGRITYRHK